MSEIQQIGLQETDGENELLLSLNLPEEMKDRFKEVLDRFQTTKDKAKLQSQLEKLLSGAEVETDPANQTHLTITCNPDLPMPDALSSEGE